MKYWDIESSFMPFTTKLVKYFPCKSHEKHVVDFSTSVKMHILQVETQTWHICISGLK